jgi:hypothetical protein
VLTVCLIAAAGCSSGRPKPEASPTVSEPLPLRALLSARAAQASTRYFTAAYTMSGLENGAKQTVTIARSADGFGWTS